MNVGNACSANDECELGDGGAGTVCDTICKRGKLDEHVTRFYFFFKADDQLSCKANLTDGPEICFETL